MKSSYNIYFELGKKRVIAGAIDWPGWCRIGRDEASALQTLLDYGPRYASVIQRARLAFRVPVEISELKVVERLSGDATTDFGVPGKVPSEDAKPLDPAGLQRSQAILKACWAAFDAATAAAKGKELRKGPRGGGRELEAIVAHVQGAEGGYLSRLDWKLKGVTGASSEQEISGARQVILDALASAAGGEIPARGPRGGALWPPRYFVRRAAWHALDHAWEIEDRAA